MAITPATGMNSGVNTSALLEAMVGSQKAAVQVIENRKKTFEDRAAAVRDINSSFLSTQLDAIALKQKSTFNARSATVGNSTALSATASGTAQLGNYQFEVTGVAAAHQIATGKTGGVASRTDDLGVGSIDIRLGTGAVHSFSFGTSDSSLDDMAAKINDAGIGINAYVISSGSGATPYRLVLQSRDTGLSNQIVLSNDTGSASTLFAGTNMDTLTAASDAGIKLGTGAAAIQFSSSSNTFTDIVPGLTLTAKALGTSSVVVGNDLTVASSALATFMKSMNEALTNYITQSSYDPSGANSGVLFSEGGVRRAVDDAKNAIFTVLPSLDKSLNNVTALGLGLDQETGLLSLDQDKLDAVLAKDPDAVAKMFLSGGTSTDTSISFGAITEKTKADTAFAVNITTAAERAISLSGVLTEPVTLTTSDRQFSLKVNNSTYTVTLATGDYTVASLASHMQQALDEAITTKSDKVVVEATGGALKISTVRYGAGASLEILASSANAVLGLSTTADTGVDVAGTIAGQAATGIGQVLTAGSATSSPAKDAEGLSLIITSQVPTSATFTVRRGLGQIISEALKGLTDVDTGTLTQEENGFNDAVADMTERIDSFNARIEERMARYQRQLNVMEELLGQYKSQQNFLAGQIKGFENSASARSGG